MAKTKGTIYKEENTISQPELLNQLMDAVRELEEKMKATVPIKRGQLRIGFGVSKTQRGIAADAVISIAKAIKSANGW